MWAKSRNGDMSLVMRDHVSISSSDGIFIDKCGYFEFKEYNDDGLISIWKRKELPKLAPFEKEFLKALKPAYRNGWIARDKGGDLYAHDREPIKNGLGWVSRYCYEISDFANFPLFSRESFTWCQWEDEEPWYIPDLLKEA